MNGRITDDLPLRCEEGQLIFACPGQSTQLDAMDFRASGWCQLGNGSGIGEQNWQLGISVPAVLMMCERLKRWISVA